MASLIPLYKKRLNLPEAQFTFIDHEDAMVAAVFKITQPGYPDLILKVCSRKGDFLRESYFLSRFAGKISVPKIIQLIEPDACWKHADGILIKILTSFCPLMVLA